MGRLSMTDVALFGADPSPEARVKLVQKIVGAIDPANLTEPERAIADEIFGVMARDAERLVRIELAHSLKHSPILSRKLACRLAADVDEVALPVLSASSIFSDEDLVDIVRRGAPAKQTAIAGRSSVSAVVAGALVETDNADAVATLLRNADAALDGTLLSRTLERFGASEDVQRGVARRSILPIAVAERLVAIASEVICAELMERDDIQPQIATSLVLRSRERATLNLRSIASSDESAEELVAHLIEAGRLTPSFCLRALCVGDLALFEIAMARMAGLPLVNTRYLLHDAGELGFQTLFAKTGMASFLKPAFRVALTVALEMVGADGPDDRHEREEVAIQRILTQFEAIGSDDLDFLLNRLEMTATRQSVAAHQAISAPLPA